MNQSYTCAMGLLLVAGVMTALAPQAAAAEPARLCNAAALHASPVGQWELDLGPDRKATLALALPADRNVLLEAQEVDVDVDLEVATSTTPTSYASNPNQRRGILRSSFLTDHSGQTMLHLRATSDGGLGHRVTLRAFEEAQPTDVCGSVTQALSAGDAAFEKARRVSDGLGSSNAGTAADFYADAYREYERGLAALAPQNAALRAEISNALATLSCQYLQHWQDCERWATQAVKLWDLAGDAEGRADALSLQALSWMELAQLPDAATAADPIRPDSHVLVHRALQQLRGLASFYMKRGKRLDAAEQLNLVGLTSYDTGDYAAALRAYGRARSLCESIGAQYRLALVLQNIALVNWDLGRVSTALDTYGQALALVNVGNSPALYAMILNNYGLANRTAGHLDTALAQHAQALDLTTDIQVNAGRGRSLLGLGMVYSAVGDRDLAATFLHQALDTFSQGGEGRDSVSALRALANIEALDGHHEAAIQLDREALAHATSPIVRTRLLAQIADSESLVGRNQTATDDLDLAERIAGTHDSVTQSLVQRERGVLDYRAGRLSRARTLLQAVLSTDRAFGLNAAAFDTHVILAQVEVAAGHTALALRHLDAALKLSEVLRVQVSAPELRATSMQPLRPASDLKVDLLARAYRQATLSGDSLGAERIARAALAVTEHARSRVMRDISVADYTHGATARVDLLLNSKSKLLGDLAAHEDRLEADGVNATAAPRLATIRADVSRLRGQLAVVDSQLAMLSRSAPEGSRGRAQAVLPSDVAVISYWLSASETYAWLQTRSSVRLVHLGPADTVRAAAEAARAAYNSPDLTNTEERLRAGASLSHWVLQPLLPQVPATVTRLIIVPDGPLHYVSFAALPMRVEAPDSFLIGRYEVAYGSSIATALTPDDHRQPADGMLLVTDAVYAADDPRLGHVQSPPTLLAAERPRMRGALNMDTLERLPGTAAEASGIAHLATSLTVDNLEGFDATRNGVLSRPLEHYRYIHFAVHATTDSEIPQLSSLILSGYDASGHRLENRIWAGDLMGRRFNARTVVLSACDTALGRDVGGEGLFGLRYVILARGAHAVVASLWAVPDRSTATLMHAFYKGLLQDNLPPEAALTDAMRQMLQQGPRDPAFWAPFTVTITSLH